MWFYLLLGGLSLAVYFLFFYKSRSQKLLQAFPRPEDDHHPILGMIPLFIRLKRNEFLPHLCSWGDKYGSIVRLDSPFGTALFISRAEHAEKILTSSVNITKGFDYDYVRPWLGDSLLMSTGEKWARKRKMLTPAFHFRILEDFMHVFNRESQKMVDILSKQELGASTPFDIFQYVTKCALDVICETAMGTSVHAQERGEEDEYISAIYEISQVIQNRSFRPWYRFEPVWRFSSMYARHQELLGILHGFSARVIQGRKAVQKDASAGNSNSNSNDDDEGVPKKKRLAFLDLLLQVQAEKGEGALSDLDIREETDTFMFEGHDTTATSVSFSLFALGAYPKIQENVSEELRAIFGDDQKRDATTEDLSKMKYLECVIKESLRLYPSVPFIQRKMEEDLTLGDGRIIPKGATVGMFIYKIHQDPKVFPNPSTFDPDRHNNNKSASSQSPFEYIPFSAGPRNCIGQKFAMMEEKVMISTVIRNFKINAVTRPEEVKLVAEMILRSEGGLFVKLSPR